MAAEWFLPCIFLSQVIFFVLYKFRLQWKYLPFAVSILLMALGLLMPSQNIILITVILRSLVGVGFFAIGFYCSGVIQNKEPCWFNAIITVAFLSLALINGIVDLSSLEFSNVLLYFLNGILGSYLLIQFSSWITETRRQNKAILKFINFMGENTLVILGTHTILIEIIRLIDYKVFHDVLPSFGLLEGIVFCAIVLCCEMPIIPFVNRYFPFLLGKRLKEGT